jgi:hypothetical protein
MTRGEPTTSDRIMALTADPKLRPMPHSLGGEGRMKPTDNVMPCDAAPLPHQIVDFGEGERALRVTRDAAAYLAEYTCLCGADRFALTMRRSCRSGRSQRR